MTTVALSINIELDDQFFEDILVTALEGGSNYWIKHIGINRTNEIKQKDIPNSIWVARVINNSGSVHIYPMGTEEETSSLNTYLEKIMLINGVDMWTKNHPNRLEIVRDNHGLLTIDSCNIDASDADAILQYALFGKVVFG